MSFVDEDREANGHSRSGASQDQTVEKDLNRRGKLC
jgi:hypothetical protein